jgi:FeS assembly SUF system regulator
MLRISKLTDYGIVIATHLASCGEPHPVSDLSVETQIPAPTVAKVLKALAKAEVVVSQRGARGGYQLARRPEDISVVQIIEALDGPIAVTECVDDESVCSHEARCSVRANWQRINDAVFAALENIRLSDMAEPGGERLVQLVRSSGEANRVRVSV